MSDHLKATGSPSAEIVTPAPSGALPSVKVLTKQFEFLDRLRKSGVTNMFGASLYLEEAFDLRRRTGAPILSAWMKTFSNEPAATRAQKAKG